MIDTWLGPFGADGVSIAEAPKVWSGWYSEGGVLTSDVAVFRNADGLLEVFVRGTDNALWHNWQALRSLEDHFEPGGASPSPGSGGHRVFRFAASRRGTARLSLAHRQVWEPAGGHETQLTLIIHP